jgi:hypothetical protein
VLLGWALNWTKDVYWPLDKRVHRERKASDLEMMR